MNLELAQLAGMAVTAGLVILPSLPNNNYWSLVIGRDQVDMCIAQLQTADPNRFNYHISILAPVLQVIHTNQLLTFDEASELILTYQNYLYDGPHDKLIKIL
jgi:hypothetical protein